MTSQRDSFLEEIRDLRGELGRLLEGMDYCFDWRPSDGEWSARDLVYHLVDTPEGGIDAAIEGVLQGRIQELPVAASLNNLTPERQAKDITAAQEDIEAVLLGVDGALASATDADLSGRRLTLNSLTYSRTREMAAQELVEGLFLRHWMEHLAQLAALRDALGLS